MSGFGPVTLPGRGAAASPADSTRLLIIDASLMTRAATVQAATASGCRLSIAEGIEPALAQIEAERPSLVMLDAATAWKQGSEAFARLKQPKFGNLPVVLVADHATPAELIEECWRWGIDDCLLRPVRAGDIRARCEAAAGRRDALAEPRSERQSRRILLLEGGDPTLADRVAQVFELNGHRLLRLPADGLAPGRLAVPDEEPLDLVVILADQPSPILQRLREAMPALATLPLIVVAREPAPADRLPGLQLIGWFDRQQAPPESVGERANRHFNIGIRTLQVDQRVPFFCPVEFREWGNPQASWCTSFSFNVSAGGIFLCTLVPARPRAALELRIHLTTTREELPATGVVAWANRLPTRRIYSYPVGMGVQFLGMPLSKRLAQLIEICRSTTAA